jgi:signal transduction histidine kinase/ActR/RegA family two-component response regulator
METISARRMATLRRLRQRDPEVQDVESACRTFARLLGEDPYDVPFAAIYALDENGSEAKLCAWSGLDPAPLPAVVSSAHGAHDPWCLARALRTRRAEEFALTTRLVPCAGPETITRALVLPIPASAPDRIAGVLLTGFSPQSVADEHYLTFFELLAGQLGSAIADARALEAERRRAQFIAMLGHELRNPLAPILTSLELMDLQGSDTFQAEREIIARQVRHLARLVDDLLEVSHLTLGKLHLSRGHESIQSILSQALEIVSPLLTQRQHQLSVDVAPGLGVYGDSQRLSEVFANLLMNAVRYTPEGGCIAVEATAESDQVRVSVRDNGVGIRPEILPRIFELFVQEQQDLDRAQGGLGLGLTIVRSLVALHGGSIEAHSDGYMKGSEFIVRLPAADLPLRREPPPPEAPRKRDACRRHVLVVDDNQDAAESLAGALSMLGYSVEIAHDGQSALQKLHEFAPDVALLDIGLPVMDGYELARKIRERGSLIRLLALTGYGQPRDRERSAAAGFDQHLVKPIDLALLQGAIEGTDSRGSARR